MTLSTVDFSYIAGLVKKGSGIFLPPDKYYLVESRLFPLIKKFGCADISELVSKSRTGPDAALLVDVIIESMTTNESSFFRDGRPFEQLKKIMVPTILSANPEQTDFKIWSAACSTGQEAYSIAMTILENREWQNKYKFSIDASDISQRVLDKASSGVYSQFEAQRGIPITMLLKYFKQEGENWTVVDKIRSMVTFSKINLTEPFVNRGPYDIVFCRNVLIYFENETKVRVLHQISKALKPNGMLVVGGTEAVMNTDLFTMLGDNLGVYVLKK